MPIKRLFLHAQAITFTVASKNISLECPLSGELEAVLDFLRQQR